MLALQWPSPPRNILFVRKDNDEQVQSALLEYVDHVKTTYPDSNIVFERYVAEQIHDKLAFPIYTLNGEGTNVPYYDKVDLTTTLGGDGTILHAASLFATAKSVPPVLSFSMGTLGFLGEWKFKDYKRAFREVYVSGHPPALSDSIIDGGSGPRLTTSASGWKSSALKGKSMGPSRASRILLRNRLRIGIFDSKGERLPHEPPFAHSGNKCEDIFALNEVLLHRGALPHLAHITILIGSTPASGG